MNRKTFAGFSSCLLVLPLVFLQGCSGGGGGNSPSPQPTATPTASARSLVVQLRDAAGNSVEGIVTVGAQVKATSAGQATFKGVAAGTVSVSAEVNGQTTTKNAVVAATGTTTFAVTIASGVTPAPTGTLPPPPF